jgi:hypothetical protein
MQKKLKLAVEELTVATFETDRSNERVLMEAFDISGVRPTCVSCPTKVNTCCTP